MDHYHPSMGKLQFNLCHLFQPFICLIFLLTYYLLVVLLKRQIVSVVFFPTHCISYSVVKHMAVYIFGVRSLSFCRAKNWSSTSNRQYPCIRIAPSPALMTRASLIWLMQGIFPSLFRQCSTYNFACDACEFAKHRRVSYPRSLHKSTAPFMIVFLMCGTLL